ncbi:hypothetical protein ECC02_013173 [Trypanosoma cruzi]|uniref:Uncharacterized protein n=1 Tax=Trypanosoma cruzi TaxID=5693 RepID=A0A7J6XIJ4_TRYCR|nr:hypothetical protein ECC02_013173 [Trypanosoma cruzi]
MHRKRRIVRLDDRIGHLGGRNDGEGHHDAVWVPLAQLRDEQSSHARARTTAKRVADLEALQAVAALRLLAANVQHGINQLCALRVVALGPVVACARLTKDEVVRAEDLPVWTSAHGVHRAGLQVDKHRTGHVAAARCLIKVHIDALQLKVRIALVCSRWVHTVFVADHLPELRADLVAALAGLNAHNLTHFLVLMMMFLLFAFFMYVLLFSLLSLAQWLNE